jgi:hypothetical protein
MGTAPYWVRIEGRGYFIRFVSHAPEARWVYTQNRADAYCFASVEDGNRVVGQLKRYGREARVVTIQPPPPPPVPIEFGPPNRLRPWVDRILEAGRTSSVKAGYRTLARRYHPDVGGSTADMQALTDAFGWLRTHEIPFDMAYPSDELTDDDIPF